MVDVVYNSFSTNILSGLFDLREAGDDVKVALVESGYTPNRDTHEFFSDITNELSGTGYTAGGNPIDSQTVTQDNTDNEGVFDGLDVTWTGIDAGTAAGMVLYVDTGTPATSRLIAFQDSGGFPTVTTGADLTVQWAVEGILNVNSP